MAATQVRSGQITQPAGWIADATVSRADLNVLGTTGTTVIAKLIQSTGIQLSSNGTDPGTGDVTISLATRLPLGSGTVSSPTYGFSVDGACGLYAQGSAGAVDVTQIATGNAFIAGKSGAGAYYNIYWDGANYQRLNTANRGSTLEVTSTLPISVATCAAGTNPATMTALMSLDTSGNLTIAGRLSSATAVPKITVLTAASGTFNCSANVKLLMVECIGGGGGGGGALGTASTTMSAGGGGGGGYTRRLQASPAASYTYIVGAGGAGGLATGTAGSLGGVTSFGATSICTANGGNGGGTGNAAATGPVQSSVGGAGGAATGVGDISFRGSDGQRGLRWSGTSGASGAGGASPYGGGEIQGVANAAAGSAGSQYGGGGAGALSTSTTGFAGGAGSQGVIIVTEYF
jgi:hypothetical protein